MRLLSKAHAKQSCFANPVEQSACTASATGHHLQRIQTIVENVYVWLVGPRCLMSER